MSSSNEDQYQQHPQLGYDAQRVVLEQSIDQEQTELQYSEHYLGNEAVEEDDEEDEEFQHGEDAKSPSFPPLQRQNHMSRTLQKEDFDNSGNDTVFAGIKLDITKLKK